ncbi:hypothetical protein [Micromonospora wenchangensis]|uniref:hypothetical protein n=1 Tax=Micromonospora wenchangensis TaxID=1185415 RepID=UPI003D7458BC
MTTGDFTGTRAPGGVPHWHTVRRSRLFTVLPAVVLGLLGVNFVWEAVRRNVDVAATTEWPLRFSLVDLQTTVAVGAALAGLMLTRAQFARANQPRFGYSWTPHGTDGGRWELHLSNTGPGFAGVTRVDYRFGDGPWLPYQTFQEELAARGVRPVDADFFWLGRAPLPPQPKLTEGYRLGSFTVDGLVRCDPFEIRIQADDQLGDRHQLVINSTARLPVPAWSQVVRSRADTPPH